MLLCRVRILCKPTPRSMMLGLPCSVLGLLLRGWAAGHLAKDRELATSGPYAYIRATRFTSVLLSPRSVLLSLRVTRGWRYSLRWCSSSSICRLSNSKSSTCVIILRDYATYANRVNRFLPAEGTPLRQRAFSMALYLRNEEYKAALGWCIAVAWLVLEMLVLAAH